MDRRLASVRISAELLFQWLTTGNIMMHRCTAGLPEDAVFLYDYFDEPRGEGVFVFAHESFQPVEVGAIIPEIPIEYRQLSVKIVEDECLDGS